MFANEPQPRFGEPWTPNQTTPTSDPAGCFNLQNMTQVVEVIIGKDKTKTIWLLHRKLFENSSTLARTHLQTPSEDNNDDKKVIRLPNEDPKMFREYVKFLYAGCITRSTLDDLVRMYALGRRLHAAKFMEVCYTSATLLEHQKCSTEAIIHAFNFTAKGDIFRNFMMKHIGRGVLAGKYSWKDEHDKKLLNPIMGDLMESVTDAIAQQRPAFSGTTTNPSPFDQACPPPAKSHFFCDQGFGFSTSSASSLNANFTPPTAGTAEPGFSPFQEKDGSTTVKFQSISRMPAYCRYSAEELRLADYVSGRRYGQGEFTTTQDAFGFHKHSSFGSNTQTGFGSRLFGGTVPETLGCFGSNNALPPLFNSRTTSNNNISGGLFGAHGQNLPQSQSVFGAPPADLAATQGASLFAQPNLQRSGSVFGNSGASQSGDLCATQSFPSPGISRPNLLAPSQHRHERSGGLFGPAVSNTTVPYIALPPGHGITCPFGSWSLGQQGPKCNCRDIYSSEKISTAGHSKTENVTTPAERVVTSQPIQPSRLAEAETAASQSSSSPKGGQHSPAPASTTANAMKIAKAQELSDPASANQAPIIPSPTRLTFADVDVDEDEDEDENENEDEDDSFTEVALPPAADDDL